MNKINPLTVLKLLQEDYRGIFGEDEFPTEDDLRLKTCLKDVIDKHIEKETGDPVYPEKDLDFELSIEGLSFKEFERAISSSNQLDNPDVSLNKDLSEPSTEETEPSSHELCDPRLEISMPSKSVVSQDYKKRAVTFWRSSKKKRRGLRCVQNSFAKVTSIRMLEQWEKQTESGGSRKDKLKALHSATAEKFFDAKQNLHIVKDSDIGRWALDVNKTVSLSGFKVSHDWINTFKRYYGVRDRKITKYVTMKAVAEKPEMDQNIEEFKILVRSRIEEFGLNCIYNTDQSGFEYEMRPGRTLHASGEKHVLALTQSHNSMTHFYTVMMTLSPGHTKFHPLLFITLQEEGGKFGPRVGPSMFRADNLHITASSSGKMTKVLFLDYCKTVLFPHVGARCILLADSWTTYNDRAAVLSLKLTGTEYEMLTIPKGTTAVLQPLDILCFRMYKDFFRKICNWIFVNGEPVQVRHRDVVLKLHSLTYRQFCSPRFENLITEAWHKSGYTDDHVKYITPAKFCLV